LIRFSGLQCAASDSIRVLAWGKMLCFYGKLPGLFDGGSHFQIDGAIMLCRSTLPIGRVKRTGAERWMHAESLARKEQRESACLAFEIIYVV